MSNSEYPDANNSSSLKEGQNGASTCENELKHSDAASTPTDFATNNALLDVRSAVLKRLATQLEYYFSKQNLSTDTYIQTLRSLNDGCVPVPILANFSKVKAIVMSNPEFVNNEDSRILAVLDAVRGGFTNLLEVHSIDKTTGKIVISNDGESTSVKYILAVGPVTKKPLENVVTSSALPIETDRCLARPSQQASNTIILREVLPHVTEDEVRNLFNEIPDCPPISSISRDIANCWFITLDTAERELMMNIMLQLRTMLLGGEYVLARLKASSAVYASVNVYAPPIIQEESSGSITGTRGSNEIRKPKKKVRSKKSRRRSNFTSSSKSVVSADVKKTNSPPLLTVDHFPSLQVEKKVEWETSPDDRGQSCKGLSDDKSEGSGDSPKSLKGLSDGCSTATTTSSSTDSVPKKIVSVGGYAAALLKPSTASVVSVRASEVNKNVESDNLQSQAVDENRDTSNHETLNHETSKTVAPVSSVWGKRRSFADVLRQEKLEISSRS